LLEQIFLRFLVGGVVVSIFSVIGDILEPKSFAGLFGAAPSVALATLGMAMAIEGRRFAAAEGRSMIGGAIGLLFYAAAVSGLMMRYKCSALQATTALIPVWFVVAFGSWRLFLR
jgi:Protein of unknown function (DUF3147)